MSTAMKFENCGNIQITNSRSSGFDIGIDAKNSTINVDNYISNDRQAVTFSNVSGSLNNVRALFKEGFRLSDADGAEGVRRKALKTISDAPISHGEKEDLMRDLNQVFDSSTEEDLKKAKQSFLDKSAQYATVLGFVWQVVSSIMGK